MAERYDNEWRKSRIAARILLRKDAGLTLSARDIRLARLLADDPAVTNRLIDQACSSLRAGRRERHVSAH